MRNPEDRLRKDYDVVENLGDLIAAREERDSAFADDVDAMEDIDLDHLTVDPDVELTYPHKHVASEDHKLGLDAELMDTPDVKNVEFDWQDSAEEMLLTDPDPNEGVGDESVIESYSFVLPDDVLDLDSTEKSSETTVPAVSPDLEET